MRTTPDDPTHADGTLPGGPAAPPASAAAREPAVPAGGGLVGAAGRAGASDNDNDNDRGHTPRRGAPLPVAAAVATVWAALLSYALVVVLVAAGAWASGVPATGIARLAAAGWLLAHGVPVQAPADRISLVPLAISALVFWRLMRAGVHASRAVGGHRLRSPTRAVGAGAAVAVGYAGIGFAISMLARSTDVGLSPGRSALTLGLVGGGAAIGGALLHSRSGRRMAAATPAVVGDALRGGLAAAALIVAAGAAAAGVAVAIHGGAGAEMLGSYRAGVLGQAGVTGLCLAYLPNVAVWGAAYLLGPGFAVGTATVVSPGEVVLGSVPGLPVLAGLPSAALSGAGPALLGIPFLAGMAVGWLMARRRPGQAWTGVLGGAALSGPVAGAAVQAACLASSGSLGSGRLAVMGPTDWRVGLFAMVVISVGALVGAAIALPAGRPPRS